MKWISKTDLRITPEDAESSIDKSPVTFRQVGWLGFSGKYYPLGEHVDEPAGFSPLYIQIGD